MGIRFDPTPPKGDPSAAIAAFAKSIGKGIQGDFLGAGEEFYASAKSLRSTKDETAPQRAWTLWRESITAALAEICALPRLSSRPDNKQFREIITDVLTTSADHAQAKQIELMGAHLNRPQDILLYRAIRERLPDLIHRYNTAKAIGPDALRGKLDQAFALWFSRIWVEGDGYFELHEASLDGPAGQIIERHYEWQRYYDLLRRDVEEKPLFGQEEGGATLEDIFVPLRCYWRERSESMSDNDAALPVNAHVTMLEDSLHDWLNTKDPKDPLRVVTGGPGCGKSSTAKVFARDVSRAGDWNVYLVPLQGMRVDADIEAIVVEYAKMVKRNAGSLSVSPLENDRDDLKPLLLVFDGLDEVAKPGIEGDDATRKFLGNLKHWLEGANGENATVFSVVLGRPLAAEGAAFHVALRDCALLHTAPLNNLAHKNDEDEVEFDNRVFARSSDRKVIVHDPSNLCLMDQRATFWQRYHAIDADCPAQPADEILGDGLRELTVEPLLLYLLLFSGLAGSRWQEAADNRNRVYQEIFQNLHTRDVDKPRAEIKQGVTKLADFFTLMECLGLAAWKGGGRTGTTKQFKRLRDTVYAPEKKKRFKDVAQAELHNVALQFYTRKPGPDEQSYDFIHKSFGEYLTARALIEAGEKLLSGYAQNGDEEAFALRWLKLTGEQRITREVLVFLIDEGRLRAVRMPGDPPDLMHIREKIDVLTQIASWVLANGFPAHADLGFNEGGLSWREREAAQANAESALFALIHVWGLVAFPDDLCGSDGEGGWEPGAINIEWPDTDTLSRLLDRWRRHPSGMDSRMRHTDGRIISTELERAFLRGLHLDGATLDGARLDGATLDGARLDGARLDGARLDGATLKSANCRRWHIDSARLQFADLRKCTSLDPDSVKTANGNSRTLLPDGMTRPDHWPEAKYETWEEVLAAGDPDG